MAENPLVTDDDASDRMQAGAPAVSAGRRKAKKKKTATPA